MNYKYNGNLPAGGDPGKMGRLKWFFGGTKNVPGVHVTRKFQSYVSPNIRHFSKFSSKNLCSPVFCSLLENRPSPVHPVPRSPLRSTCNTAQNTPLPEYH